MASITELKQARDTLDQLISARDEQLAILSDALTGLLAAGASDDVIDRVMTVIELVDAGTITEDKAEGITEDYVDDVPADEPVSIRKQVIADLRAQGYVAPGFDALVRLYHRDIVEQEWTRAEQDCNGQLVRPEHRGTYTSTRNFWSCNTRELKKYASEELLEWFDRNGRITYSELRDRMLGGKHYAGSGYYNS